MNQMMFSDGSIVMLVDDGLELMYPSGDTLIQPEAAPAGGAFSIFDSPIITAAA
jgi:hypothetical protein